MFPSGWRKVADSPSLGVSFSTLHVCAAARFSPDTYQLQHRVKQKGCYSRASEAGASPASREQWKGSPRVEVAEQSWPGEEESCGQGGRCYIFTRLSRVPARAVPLPCGDPPRSHQLPISPPPRCWARPCLLHHGKPLIGIAESQERWTSSG